MEAGRRGRSSRTTYTHTYSHEAQRLSLAQVEVTGASSACSVEGTAGTSGTSGSNVMIAGRSGFTILTADGAL